jgi:hypothetical protein
MLAPLVDHTDARSDHFVQWRDSARNGLSIGAILLLRGRGHALEGTFTNRT